MRDEWVETLRLGPLDSNLFSDTTVVQTLVLLNHSLIILDCL